MSRAPVSLPGEPHVDQAQARSHGLSPDEFRNIQRILGRTPTFTELGVFSVMWSEHCSYKSSRKYLRTLPNRGELVVQGPGENAGAIDVGDGWVAVFKIESHNHPSFVEPYQGAATGVGGILRDIFTMGARPIASMDSLKFGSFDHPRTRYLLGGVVGGIGGYGELMSAKASGVGNTVLYVGSATGRDGIHGASLLASAEFDAESESKRPTVQVGDPFTEKLLIEACLEAARTGAIVAIQDMGAAGLTSSSSVMAARGALGIDLDLDKIPLREQNLTPYEMLLSESQERMLIVAARGRETELQAVFEKWDLHAAVIGEIIAEPRWRARWRGQVVADIPVGALADDAPVYDRPVKPAAPSRNGASAPDQHPAPSAALKALLENPNVASKRWVFRQYDSLVQGNTVAGPGPSDAAVLRLKHSKRAIALKVDSNPRACALDPYLGAVATVVESARNVACAGARPVGITNCLNYGNPERPEIMWQFVEGVRGLGDAARAFGAPVVSGNVSFYNETEGRAILPTPTIAVLGVMRDVTRQVTSFFKQPGDAILLVRTNPPRLAASEYGAMFGGAEDTLGSIDLQREAALLDGLIAGAEQGLIKSAHDVADGGLMVALAEACFNPDGVVGAEADFAALGLASTAELFGEGASTVLISVSTKDVEQVAQIFCSRGIDCRSIGRVIAEARLRLSPVVDDDVLDLQRTYEHALPGRLANE
jgi:phosphoribosylformylglycinamidine synthase II